MYFFLAAALATNFWLKTVAFWHLVGSSPFKIAPLMALHALLHDLDDFKDLMQAGALSTITAADLAPHAVINGVLASAVKPSCSTTRAANTANGMLYCILGVGSQF